MQVSLQTLFYLIFFVSSCSVTEKMSKGESEINQTSKTELIAKKWLLTKSKDPYNKGAFTERSKEEEKTIHFFKDRTYIEKDPWQENKGIWFFNEDESKLSMNLSERGEANYRWTLVKLDEKELVLAIQGRHGMVEYYYEVLD